MFSFTLEQIHGIDLLIFGLTLQSYFTESQRWAFFNFLSGMALLGVEIRGGASSHHVQYISSGIFVVKDDIVCEIQARTRYLVVSETTLPANVEGLLNS